jgi:putative PEP-CTERM system TPR-repeat lipoprotein
MAMRPRFPLRASLLVATTLAGLLSAGAALAQPLERARAAEGRGDLRAAQIEYRNAVRSQPQNGAVRAGLARVSLELGDYETTDREARAAIEARHEVPAMTALLIRSQLARGRFREVLRDFPVPENAPAVGAQVAAGRALAELALNERDAARASVATALRLAPNAVEPRLAAASLALADGNRAAAEAEVDQAITADPTSPDALLRKASFQAERGELPAAIATLDRLVAAAPGHANGRVLRGELRMRGGDDAGARQDAEAALRVQPGSVPGTYLTAMLQARAQDWRAADATLQRMARVLPNIPDGLLLQATVKRALNERGQAEDAAQRHFARRPEDPRGAKLLAALQVEDNRPDAAAATLAMLAQRGGADAEAFDMLARAHTAMGRPREAARALQQAVELSPRDAGLQARLAAARLAMGDATGSARAAEAALQANAAEPGAREVLAIAALSRGDVTGAQAAWEQLDATQRLGEAAGTLEGLLALARFDLPAARTAFETVLRNHPETIGARLGLARIATAQGNPAEAERLLGEVLRRSPDHPEALGRLRVTIAGGGPRAATARAVLEAAQAAAPTEDGLALALAGALAATGETARGLAVLDTEALRRPGQGPALPLARSQLHAGLEQWEAAEDAARLALAEDTTSVAARRQLMALRLRAEDPRGAEAVIEQGLRAEPGNALLQQLMVTLVRQTRGLDAALESADRLAENPAARPAALSLRGELLLAAQRPADAARAFAAAHARAPSSTFVLREASAWQAAGQTDAAIAALNAWLAREPGDIGALNLMAQFDIMGGRTADAVRRLTTLVERAPDNAIAMNNLAWLVGEAGTGEELVRALRMAERAYFLLPTPETADTFGWLLARSGETGRAVTLLRQAVASQPQGQAGDPDKVFRLAYTLRAAGQREEALRTLEPLLAERASFPRRAEAERLMADLRAGR